MEIKACYTMEDVKKVLAKVCNHNSIDYQSFEKDFDVEINHTGSDEDDSFQYQMADFDNITPNDFTLGSSWKVPCIVFIYYEDSYDRQGNISCHIIYAATFEEVGIKESLIDKIKRWFNFN